MPSTVKTTFSVPCTIVAFDKKDHRKPTDLIDGLNAIVEGSKEDIVNWLRPFDAVWVGNGIPQTETFEIMHIRDDA